MIEVMLRIYYAPPIEVSVRYAVYKAVVLPTGKWKVLDAAPVVLDQYLFPADATSNLFFLFSRDVNS